MVPNLIYGKYWTCYRRGNCQVRPWTLTKGRHCRFRWHFHMWAKFGWHNHPIFKGEDEREVRDHDPFQCHQQTPRTILVFIDVTRDTEWQDGAVFPRPFIHSFVHAGTQWPCLGVSAFLSHFEFPGELPEDTACKVEEFRWTRKDLEAFAVDVQSRGIYFWWWSCWYLDSRVRGTPLINSRTNCWRRAVRSSEQHWSLMPLHAVCSTVRPASFMYGLGAGYGGPNAMSFPQLVAHILKLTRTCWWLLLDG